MRIYPLFCYNSSKNSIKLLPRKTHRRLLQKPEENKERRENRERELEEFLREFSEEMLCD
jgi:hypothetical protein